MDVGLGFFRHGLLNGIQQRIRILIWRYRDRQFVPEPLPAGGEVEEVALNGIAVDERYLAASGMAAFGPVARFEQYRAQQIDLDDFAGNAVDLDQVADAQSVFSHQHKPAEEGYDEILHRHRDSRRGQSKEGGGLLWSTGDHKQNKQNAHGLHGKTNDGTKGVQAGARTHFGEAAVDRAVGKIHHQHNEDDEERRLEHAMQRGALVRTDYRNPSRIAVGQFLLILNALVQVSQILLVIGKTMQSLDRRVCSGGHGAWLACGLTGIGWTCLPEFV